MTFWYGSGSPDPYLWLTDPEVIKSHKTVEINVFLNFFAWWWKDPDPTNNEEFGFGRPKNLRIWSQCFRFSLVSINPDPTSAPLNKMLIRTIVPIKIFHLYFYYSSFRNFNFIIWKREVKFTFSTIRYVVSKRYLGWYSYCRIYKGILKCKKIVMFCNFRCYPMGGHNIY